MKRHLIAGLLAGFTAACVGYGEERVVAPAAEVKPIEPTSTPQAEVPAPSRWLGRFECVDCTGIELRLALEADATYRLEQVFLGTPEGDKSFATEGAWSTDVGIAEDAAAVVVRLAPAGGAPERILLLVDGGDALELLDQTGHRVAGAGDSNRLERQDP
jgi:hypothetical protein